MPPETSTSLLRHARDCTDANSWQRLVRLYSPFLYGWLRRRRVPHQDADDLAQEVFTTLAMELPSFRHNGQPGAFRCWLRTILGHRLLAYWSAQKMLQKAPADSELLAQVAEQLADPASDLSRLWDHEHDRFVARRLLEEIGREFAPNVWQAFRRVTLDGAAPEEVASELGLSVGSVYNAKYLVLKRLRQEAEHLTA